MAALSQTSMATIFTYEDNNANNGGNGIFSSDHLSSVLTSYNDSNDQFTWDAQLNLGNAANVNSFWLVVNNGPNPKASDARELAIIYGDRATQTLSTYVYNGANNAASYSSPNIFLQSDSFSWIGNQISLSLDANQHQCLG